MHQVAHIRADFIALFFICLLSLHILHISMLDFIYSLEVGNRILRLESSKRLNHIPNEFERFHIGNDVNADLILEFIDTKQEEFTKITKNTSNVGHWNIGMNKSVYFRDNEDICFIKDYERNKIQVLYVPNFLWLEVNEKNKLAFVKEKKLLSNLVFLTNQLLLNTKALILHGAGLIRNGKAYIFLASDEGGKSTLIKKNFENFIMNDDQIYYEIIKNSLMAFSTPFGKLSHGPNGAKVAAFFYITKSKSFSLKRKTKESLINSLWVDNINFFTSLPKEMKIKAFHLLTDISRSAPVFELQADHGQLDWDQIDNEILIATNELSSAQSVPPSPSPPPPPDPC